MDFVSPAGPVYQAGTLSGNPLAMAAGLATLHVLRDDPPYDRLEALSARLADGLDRAATDAGVPHVVQRVGSMLTLFFTADPVHNYEDAKRSDTKFFGRFFWEMLARGVYLPCSQFEAAFVSAAHTPADIDHTIAAAAEALKAARLNRVMPTEGRRQIPFAAPESVDGGEDVAHLVALGGEVLAAVDLVGGDDRHLVDDLEAVAVDRRRRRSSWGCWSGAGPCVRPRSWRICRPMP